MEASSARRVSRKRRDTRDPVLTDLDLRILDLLCSQRVLTSRQLAALAPENSARTLRYRCNRLAKFGLVGRTRPYRERGSAPHHLWPTRRGEALASGGPPPRGGERREPNPLFLAHAAGLSEIYVALKTTLPSGLTLTRFEREADARESFAAWPAKEERAIAPDAFIEIADADGGQLCAFIELDRGTMSNRQLRRKAAGYAEYDKADAWHARHRFCPALLFITTTEKRARSFLLAMRSQSGRGALLLTGVCDLARRLALCTTEPRWLFDDGEERTGDLLAVLREARRPHDEELAHEEAERRKEDAERERLRSDPEALRAHLRSWHERNRGTERAGVPQLAALEVTLMREKPLDEIERNALMAFSGMLSDPLEVRFADRDLTADARVELGLLLEHHRATQYEHVERLTEQLGDGPALRRARKDLAAGELRHDDELDALTREAERDREAGAKQERLRDAYLLWREGEARRLAKAQGVVARLRNGPQAFLGEVDRRALRHCETCEEIAYPDPEQAESRATRNVARRCHFCGTAFPEPKPSRSDEDRPWGRL